MGLTPPDGVELNTENKENSYEENDLKSMHSDSVE
jgi:hypothetical protein